MSHEAPLVSIVTPCYNHRRFIAQTIESVKRQTYQNIEHIVLDGASTDGSQDVIAGYESHLAYWHSQPDAGQTDAINQGWVRCTGDIVTWLNSDDCLLPQAVERVVAFFEAHPDVDIVFADCHFIDEAGNRIGVSQPRGEFNYNDFVIGCENPIPQPSAFIRRRVVDNVGMLDSSLHYKMDWDFWLRAGLKHRIAHVAEVWSEYRLHADSKTIADHHKARMPEELKVMYEKFFSQSHLPSALVKARRRAWANMYFTGAGYTIEGGDQKGGRRLALRAVRVYPLLLLRPRLIHKLLYCLFGNTAAYQLARNVAKRPHRDQESVAS